jgi:gamma-glutamyltranspeptidase
MVRQGGILTLDDLKNYRAIHRPVISTNYHGYKAFTTSALTSGPVVLNVLNLVKPYNFSMKGPTRLNYHRLIEALKFGYAGRTELEILYIPAIKIDLTSLSLKNGQIVSDLGSLM